jgi:FixJ family two-component response regulator
MPDLKIEKILIIDDSEDFRKLLIKFFEDVCPDASVDAYDPANGKPSETFVWDEYNLIILDYDLGNGENGLDWLRIFKTSSSFPPTIMLTAQGNEETVVTAFRYGAQDYLKKEGLTKGRMIESLTRALRKYQEESKKADTQQLSVHLYKKEKFYRSLDNVKIKDIIILIEIDKFHALRDDLGMLSADKTTEFVLENSLKYLADSKYSSEITRISDSNIAILIRNYQKDDQGETVCEQLCKIIDESRFEINGKSISFSLNIASVYVDDDNIKADDILKQADIACRMSRNKPGNSYTISGILCNDELIVSEQLDAHIQNVFNEDRVKPHNNILSSFQL